MFKLSAGFAILFIAFALQFWFASAGWYCSLSFAALISFAFVFGFWELLTLVLIAVFIINWQPAASAEILIFVLFPLAVHLFRNVLPWQVWLENLLAITLGLLVLYFALAPVQFFSHWQPFLLDLVASLIFGSIILFPLYRWGRE